MKNAILTAVLVTAALGAAPTQSPLIPARINAVFSQIRPNMPESEVDALIRAGFPKAILEPGEWSGTTGYSNWRLDERYTIGVAEYNAPKDFNLRFVHASMILQVYDMKAKRRIDLTIHDWGGISEKGVGKK